MTELKAYVAGINMGDHDGWMELELVIAESPEAAARLAYPKFEDERIAEVLAGEDDYSIERCEAGDSLAFGMPRIIRDDKTLREAGFHYEDEHECQACEEWSEGVCQECDLCATCRDSEPNHKPCELCEGSDEEE
jgi:hypothetical protein